MYSQYRWTVRIARTNIPLQQVRTHSYFTLQLRLFCTFVFVAELNSRSISGIVHRSPCRCPNKSVMMLRRIVLFVCVLCWVSCAKKARHHATKNVSEVLEVVTLLHSHVKHHCASGAKQHDPACIKHANKTHVVDPRFAFLPQETAHDLPIETYTWNPTLRTNVSSRLPADFRDPQFEIMSTRQLAFEDSNLHSLRYCTTCDSCNLFDGLLVTRPLHYAFFCVL